LTSSRLSTDCSGAELSAITTHDSEAVVKIIRKEREKCFIMSLPDANWPLQLIVLHVADELRFKPGSFAHPLLYSMIVLAFAG
jgi:hypothetical protein